MEDKEVIITRAEIQLKIRELVEITQDPITVKNAVEDWLTEKKASEFDTKQIMNDLTSYQEYLDLIRREGA